MRLFDLLVQAATNVLRESKESRECILSLNLFTPLLVYLSRAPDSLDKSEFYKEERLIAAISLLSAALEGQRASQDWLLANVKIEQISHGLLNSASLSLAGYTCLLISQLSALNPAAQLSFATEPFVTRLVYLLDYNELVYESDPDTPVEQLQEISFYSLLATISLVRENQAAQDLFGKQQVTAKLLKLLRAGAFEPKKTTCLCLSSVVSQNDLNKAEAI